MPTHKSAELCWGQRYVWLRHHQLPPESRHDMHLVSVFDLPPGAELSGVRSMLNYLVRRHEALRTTYDLDIHSDSDGAGPRQQVHPPRPLPVTVVTTERDGTDGPAEVVERLRHTDFDLATEWPVRACVVTSANAPVQLILVLNHIAFDAWSSERFSRELETVGAAISRGQPVNLEPIRHQPIDLAHYDGSAASLAAKNRAAECWQEEIAQVPADSFALRRRPGLDDLVPHSATLTSPALLTAGRETARRHQVWPSAVHLATYSMVMAAYAAGGQVTHLSFTGNRDSHPYSDVMTCLFSPLLMHFDGRDDPSFAEVLRQSAQRIELGQQRASLPYDELLEFVCREGVRRGEPVRLGSEFNFLSYAAQTTRARRSRLTWNPAPTAWAHSGADTYFRAYELQDAVVLSLNAVPSVMDAAAIEQVLRGYEQVLLAHADPAVNLSVSDLADLIGFEAPTQPIGTAAGNDLDRARDARADTSPSPGAATALAAAVRAANGLDLLDLTESYVSAGGRVLQIPRVLAALHAQGLAGLRVNDLAGPQPLRNLARALQETAQPLAM